jgi:sugar lactone lactonase YvrE
MQTLAKLSMQLGECPRWNATEHQWYWVDILGNSLYRFSPGTNELTQREFPFQTACFAFTQNNQIVLSSSNGIYLLNSFDGDANQIANPENHLPDNRFNDGTPTPEGDFIIGSIGDGEHPVGTTYRFSFREGACLTEEIESGFRIINAQAFSPDGTRYYVTDTPEQVVYKQSYDAITKTLGPKEVFYQCESDEYPDGAGVDTDGNFWVAMYGSSKIVVISPEGNKLKEIELPVSQPTMVAFGGENMNQLIVTSAAQNLSPADLEKEPLAGSVLIMDIDETGTLPSLVKT